MIFDQAEFELRCEWGAQGLAQLAPISDVVIVVDVLSFSTCVEIATARGAVIFPYARYDDSARAYADSLNAELAARDRSAARFTLSPQSLAEIPSGTRLVLPSPNGSTLTLMTGETPTLAGCLRNAGAVARAAREYGTRIAVIPAGERWQDGTPRPALEDWLGAGAILNELDGNFSPEALAARDAFRSALPRLAEVIAACGSGKELAAKGFAADVALACQWNVSDSVPFFSDGAYTARE